MYDLGEFAEVWHIHIIHLNYNHWLFNVTNIPLQPLLYMLLAANYAKCQPSAKEKINDRTKAYQNVIL